MQAHFSISFLYTDIQERYVQQILTLHSSLLITSFNRFLNKTKKKKSDGFMF